MQSRSQKQVQVGGVGADDDDDDGDDVGLAHTFPFIKCEFRTQSVRTLL